MLFDRSKPVRNRAGDVRLAFSQSPAVLDLVDFITADTKRAFCTPPLGSGIETSDSDDNS